MPEAVAAECSLSVVVIGEQVTSLGHHHPAVGLMDPATSILCGDCGQQSIDPGADILAIAKILAANKGLYLCKDLLGNVEPWCIRWQEEQSVAVCQDRLDEARVVVEARAVKYKCPPLALKPGQDVCNKGLKEGLTIPGPSLDVLSLDAVAINGNKEREAGAMVAWSILLCCLLARQGSAHLPCLLEVKAGLVKEDSLVQQKALTAEC